MKFLLIMFSLLLFTVCISAQQHKKIKVWIDTDPSVGQKFRDVDDGFALLQAFRSPELEIRGISVVFGNADLVHGFPIARKITSRFGPKKLKVYRGAAGKNHLGKENAATKALAAALAKEKLTLLVLGPATNVATVVKNHPHIRHNIVQIIAVAGRRPNQRFQTGTKNKKAHRDFNFELDPQGFRILLQSQIPMVLAPFEISSKVWIRSIDLQRLAAGNEATRWLATPAKDWLNLWQQVFAVDGFNPFDTLAVAYLTSPNLITYEDIPATIKVLPDDVTEERMQGTKVINKPYLLVSQQFSNARKVRYCYDVSSDFKENLLQRLLSAK